MLSIRFRFFIVSLFLAAWSGQGIALAQASKHSQFGVDFLNAVRRGDLDAIQRMTPIHPGVVEYKGQTGVTPLQLAARSERLDIVQFLLSHGANVNIKRKDGSTALSDAAANGRFPVAQLLIEKGADVNSATNVGSTPLMAAKSREITQLLLDHGADINARRADGWTALHRAAWEGHEDVVRLLIEKGADMTLKSNDGSMPIHYAARRGRPSVVQALIDKGADVDAPDIDGDTPLAIAAGFGQIGVMQYLISIGANVRSVNKAGKTPLDVAQSAKQQRAVALLTRYLAALDERASREAARTASGFRIEKSYAFWKDPKAATKTVYQTDFANGTVGPEWTAAVQGTDSGALRVSETPRGARRFLGDFGNQSVRLTLSNLPAHKEISIAFDLYVLRAWNDPLPPVWSLSIVDGPTLLQTSFNNVYGLPGSPRVKTQAYPGEYPGDHNFGRTGAEENNTLGYTMRIDNQDAAMDSVYKLRFTFPHSTPSIIINFAGTGLGRPDAESWGLTNVKASVPAETVAVAHPAVPTHHVVHPAPAVRKRIVKPTHATHVKPKAKPAVKKTSKHAQRLHELKKAPSP